MKFVALHVTLILGMKVLHLIVAALGLRVDISGRPRVTVTTII